MSADNGIYILHTKDNYKIIGDSITQNTDNTIDAYRVAHAQAIDSFDWYRKHQPYNIGAYLVDVWGGKKVFYTLEEAMEYTKRLQDNIGRTEYGINMINASDMSFYI